MKTSVISCVESRVLTTLSPSPPCGRVSSLIVMLGSVFLNPAISASACLTVGSLLSTRNESSTLPPAPLAPPPPLSSPPHPATPRAMARVASTPARFHVLSNTIPDLPDTRIAARWRWKLLHSRPLCYESFQHGDAANV